MRAGRINRAVLVFSFVVLVQSACNPLSEQATPSPSVAVPQASATLGSSGVPTVEPTLATLQVSVYAPGVRTEIAELDAIIEAVMMHDIEALRGLTEFTLVGCTHQDGLGGPPKCAENEVEGTLIEVVPFMDTEGSHLRSEEYAQWPGPDALGLLAAYRVSPDAFSEPAYPAGEYALIFLEAAGRTIVILQVFEGRVVRFDYADGGTIESILARDAEEIILPFTASAVPTAVPWNRFTDESARFTFLYAPTLTITPGPAEGTWRLGEKIEVAVLGPGPSWITCFDEALGDCPLVETDEIVNIQGHEARRVEGSIGSVGGRVPQEFLVYIFDLGEDRLVLTVYALPFDLQVSDTSMVWPLGGMELELFERMVETVTISG